MKKFSKNKKYFLQWAIRLPIRDVLYRQITVKTSYEKSSEKRG